MFNEFVIPALMMFLMLLGVVLKKFTCIKKTHLPAPVIGGLIGFVLMNTQVITLPYQVYERITFHLFSLSFISITYMSMNDKVETKKGVFKGGLWLAMVFGLIIAMQVVLGSSVFMLFNLIGDVGLPNALGGLVAHGFGQGPGQSVAMGTIWQTLDSINFSNAAQYGLFYAACGYLFAILIGIPFSKYLIKNGSVSYKTLELHEQRNFKNGIIESNQEMNIGKQTAHHSNLDTMSLHFALTGGTYFITYMLIYAIDLTSGGFSDATAALMYGNMFAWGILIAMLIKKILIKIKLNHIIDSKFQKSITGFLVDYLIVSALMAISLKQIQDGLLAMITTIVVVGVSTFFIVRYLAMRSGKYRYERMMCEYGIVTGTAATGMLLLRSVDPQFETPVIHELAWWNVLQMFAALPILTSQIGLPVTNFLAWYVVMIVAILIYLIIIYILGKSMKKV